MPEDRREMTSDEKRRYDEMLFVLYDAVHELLELREMRQKILACLKEADEKLLTDEEDSFHAFIYAHALDDIEKLCKSIQQTPVKELMKK